MPTTSICSLIAIALLAPFGQPIPVRERGSTIVQAAKLAERPGHRVRIDALGNYYVLNRSQHDIRVLDSSLRPLRRLGGFGQGPGDLFSPIDFDIERRLREVAVLEQGNQRIQVLDEEGRSLRRVAVDRRATSVAFGRDGKLYVTNASSASWLAHLTGQSPHLSSLSDRRVVPWIHRYLAESHGPRHERLKLAYEVLLGKSLARKAPDGRLVLLSIWEPQLFTFDPQRASVIKITFSAPSLESQRRQVVRQIEASIRSSKIEIFHLFQDFALSSDGRTIAIAATGDCPGLLLLDRIGRVKAEMCVVGPQREAVPVVGVEHLPGRGWLLVNETGLYLLEPPQPR